MADNTVFEVGTRVVAWCYNPVMIPSFGSYEEGVVKSIYQDTLYNSDDTESTLDIYRVHFPEHKDTYGKPRVMNHVPSSMKAIDETHSVHDLKVEMYNEHKDS